MQGLQIESSRSAKPDFSPPVVLDRIPCGKKMIYVAREDLLPGGTKQRGCIPYIRQLQADGYSEFIYASPFSGFAQIALAVACRMLNVPCVIFCERDKGNEKRADFHDFSKIAHAMGARTILVESLKEAESAACEYASIGKGRLQLPLGFNSEIFREYLRRDLVIRWKEIIHLVGHEPEVLWLPVGSGTLLRTFRSVVGSKVQIKCVNVRVLEDYDPRITGIVSDERITLFKTPERFHEPADLEPEIPSNLYYDAKLWQFLLSNANESDVWWNVAR